MGILIGCLLILFGLPFNVFGQEANLLPTDDHVLVDESFQPDSSVIEIRVPEESFLDAYRGDPDYIYIKTQNPVDSWWDLFQRWLRETMFGAVSGDRWNLFWKILQFAILGGIVVIGVMQLLRMEAGHLFYGNRTIHTAAPELSVDDIKHTDFLMEAEEAVVQGKYRQAVRLYYLQMLKMLDADGFVQWAPRKTNQDYVRECYNAALRDQLIRLTYLFDYAWYGEFEVDDKKLKEVQEIIKQVMQDRRNR